MSDSGWCSPGFVDSGCWSFKLRKSWEWKLDWFGQNGFKLGENLVTTEADPAGGLDQGELAREAQEIDDLL